MFYSNADGFNAAEALQDQILDIRRTREFQAAHGPKSVEDAPAPAYPTLSEMLDIVARHCAADPNHSPDIQCKPSITNMTQKVALGGYHGGLQSICVKKVRETLHRGGGAFTVVSSPMKGRSSMMKGGKKRSREFIFALEFGNSRGINFRNGGFLRVSGA